MLLNINSINHQNQSEKDNLEKQIKIQPEMLKGNLETEEKIGLVKWSQINSRLLDELKELSRFEEEDNYIKNTICHTLST